MMRVRVRYWRLRRPPLIAAALSVMLVACGGAAADRAEKKGATSITLIDSVEVVETDSVFVARPNSITVDGAVDQPPRQNADLLVGIKNALRIVDVPVGAARLARPKRRP